MQFICFMLTLKLLYFNLEVDFLIYLSAIKCWCGGCFIFMVPNLFILWFCVVLCNTYKRLSYLFRKDVFIDSLRKVFSAFCCIRHGKGGDLCLLCLMNVEIIANVCVYLVMCTSPICALNKCLRCILRLT